MQEQLMDLSNNEHFKNLQGLFYRLNEKYVDDILDFMSDKTSLSCLLHMFSHAKVDALVKDESEANSLRLNIKSHRYSTIIGDIDNLGNKRYDLVMMHLNLTELLDNGVDIYEFFEKMLKINCKNFIFYEYNDSRIDFLYLELAILAHEYNFFIREEIKRENKFSFGNVDADSYKLYMFYNSKNNRLF